MTPDLIARYEQRVPRYTSYPTAPHFKPDIDSQTYSRWLSELDPETTLSLYLHVPFCAELCLYCGCHTSVSRSYGPVAAYVECLEREIALVTERLPARMTVSHVHWGGGTPTMISPPDLARVFGLLQSAFGTRPDAEVAIEIDPRTLTQEHVAALAGAGLNRASLGVQDFDPKVQETIKRIQSFDRTAEVAAWLRGAGVRGINLDLMYGLPFQTTDGVLRTVELALRLDPDRIALFGYAHVPWMKRHQALLPEEALPDGVARVRQREAAAAALLAAGYEAIGIDHFAKPDDDLAVRRREGTLHRNFQGYTTDSAPALVGFGTSAIGAFPQGYVQNASATPAYRNAVMEGRLPVARGTSLTDDDRLRRSIIERLMCDFEVDLDEVAAPFSRPASTFAAEFETLRELEREGLVSRKGSRILVEEAGRPLVRAVCAVFDRYLDRKALHHAKAS